MSVPFPSVLYWTEPYRLVEMGLKSDAMAQKMENSSLRLLDDLWSEVKEFVYFRVLLPSEMEWGINRWYDVHSEVMQALYRIVVAKKEPMEAKLLIYQSVSFKVSPQVMRSQTQEPNLASSIAGWA